MRCYGSNSTLGALRSQARGMGCLDDATLDDLIEGRLSGEPLHDAEVHIDACASCSQLVAVLAGGTAHPAVELERGASVGRFVVLERHARGAMGVVYVAHDPELDRRVALKLIRPGSLASERMLREAQAMARLSHPNVVGIYDVGTHAGSVYLAMEFVAGRTLSQWLAAETRSPRDILAVFAQAGQGLSAAHAAGIVHRDFKPDNVLVGDDGRVRVTDFGLATLAGEAQSGLVGTLAYMAPEQLRGEDATARSDQFAFAVSLCEALRGARPFPGKTAAELLSAIERGPELTGMPRHEAKALGRALAADAKARHPSIDALMHALAPPPSRKRLWVGLAALVVIASTASYGLLQHRREHRCDDVHDEIDEMWNGPRSERLLVAFSRTESPVAEMASLRVRQALDRFAKGWREESLSACEKTARHGQSEALLDARMRCLDRQLAALEALLRIFEKADRSMVDHALEASLDLPSPSDCADVESIVSMDPRPADASRLESLEAELIEARATGAAGRYREAFAHAARLEAVAESVGYRPATAEAKLLSATLARKTGDFERAAKSARAALSLAEASRAERVVARAWLEIVAIEGARGRPLAVIESAELAAAVLERIGNPPELRAALLAAVGAAHIVTGALDDADRELKQALELRTRAFGEQSIQVSRTLTALGNLARARGKLADALALHQRALAIDAELLGEKHPTAATHHHNAAGVLRLMGKRDAALQSYERALALERDAFGPEHPSVGLTENSFGIVHLENGDADRARQHFERALEILTTKKHPDRAFALVNLGMVDARNNDHRQALHRFTEAIDIVKAHAGADAERLAGILDERAESALALGERASAEADRREALRILELHAQGSAEAARLRDEIRDKQIPASAPAKPTPAKPSPRRLGSTTYGAQTNWDTE